MVETVLFASGAATAVTARKARGTGHDTTSNYARCAGGSATCDSRGADSAARRPYH
ncbi:MAG TPA: hypothetical protein VH280_23280 [Verrucomicrobiae bacterium]|nr:hypothetical protein [Verrucomicrobiae bacterium]